MDKEIINMGGDRPMQFILGFEQSTMLPAWTTTIDDLWLYIVGDSLYKAIVGHQFLCINKNIDNPRDFAATMNISSFQSLLFEGEARRFQDIVNTLINFTFGNFISPSPTMYVSFINENSEHAVNAIVEFGKGIVYFGAQLGDRVKQAKLYTEIPAPVSEEEAEASTK